MSEGTLGTYTGDWFPGRAETSWNGDWYIYGEKTMLFWTGDHADWNAAN